MTSWTLWAVFLVGTLAASLVFLPYCLQNREERGAVPLAVMFVGIILWLVSELLQLQSSVPNALGGVSLRVLGSGVTVIGTVLLGVEYTGREQWLKPAVLGALAVEPAVVLTLALVRPGLLFETVPATVPWGYEIVSPSLLWMGHVVYSFSLALLGLALLAHMMWQSSYAYRLRILALMIATSVPILVNGVYQVGLLPFDLTPASFLFTAFVLMYATFRVEFMQALPVARRTVLEQMEDLVFVLDTEGRVTTVNSAVTDVFGEATQMSGVPVGQVLGEDSLGDVETGEQSREVAVPVAGETRLFDVSKTVVTDYRGDMLAQVLVCRDVTEQRRRKEQIELLKDVQSRFLRHNLRNKMNAILAHAEFMREESGPPPEDSYDTIVETSQQLIEWGEKARMIEHLVESAEQSRREVCADLAAIVDEMGARHSDVTFETDIDDEAWIVTVPQIESAFENLIDNAARYNEGDDPRVSVTTDISDGRVTIAIADNGPGINRDEIETITSGEETQLEHSSGLGLWLVYWVVETSRGDIEFETDDGTTIRLEFERVNPPADPTPDAPRIVED